MAFFMNRTGNNRPTPPIWGICVVLLGMLVFVFGGLTPIFTGNIAHMFIFIGIGIFLFLGGGILTAVTTMRNRAGLAMQSGADREYADLSHSSFYGTPQKTSTQSVSRAKPDGYGSMFDTYDQPDKTSKVGQTDGGDARICQYCGSPNEKGNRFCVTCGSQLY